LKKCRQCGIEFAPIYNSTQRACSPECAILDARDRALQAQLKRNRKQKKEFYENDRSWQTARTQEAFNKFIRVRDKNLPCISCQKFPKARYAGHYKSIGSHPELRFHEDNVNVQCDPCNRHKSGNQAEYRINLIKKIGLKRVEALETKTEAKKYTLDELRRIKQFYKDKVKEMELAL
jgi:hypothetical protein